MMWPTAALKGDTRRGRGKDRSNMFPAFVCRRQVEIGVSKEAVKCDNLDSAFKLLKETLDPPVDVYEATKRRRDVMAVGRASGRLPGRTVLTSKESKVPH